MSQLFASGGQSTGTSPSASVLPMNIQDWFPLGWTGWISLQSKGLSLQSKSLLQHHSSKASVRELCIRLPYSCIFSIVSSLAAPSTFYGLMWLYVQELLEVFAQVRCSDVNHLLRESTPSDPWTSVPVTSPVALVLCRWFISVNLPYSANLLPSVELLPNLKFISFPLGVDQTLCLSQLFGRMERQSSLKCLLNVLALSEVMKGFKLTLATSASAMTTKGKH